VITRPNRGKPIEVLIATSRYQSPPAPEGERGLDQGR
jgi:hypothetical protein